MDQQAHERDLEFIRSTVAAAHVALKAALLINGGAAVAMLAFIGNVFRACRDTSLVPALSFALLLHVFGVLAAAVATGTAYVAQAGFGNELGKHSVGLGGAFRVISCALIATSYVLFGYASWAAYMAFVSAG
jgi:hypothetical protein